MNNQSDFYEGYSYGDIVKVASKEEPGVKVIIWLYAPFVAVSLLNIQYVIWALCTGGRAWRDHRNAAFSKSFFLLLANNWLTNLLHGALILIANIYTFKPMLEEFKPVLISHHYDNQSDETWEERTNWGMVLRLGIPLTVATHALSNVAAIALTMSAESTLVSVSACADCDATFAAAFRSRILSIIAGLWSLDIVLIFCPFLAHLINETLFQTIIYSWVAYIAVMAEIWIIVLCILAYLRARKIFRDDPEYCPESVLYSILRKSIIVLIMTLIIYVTLLPWPVYEIIYTDAKLFHFVKPMLSEMPEFLQSKSLYSYVRALPYVHFLLQSILVIAFKETCWRFCLSQKKDMSEDFPEIQEEKQQLETIQRQLTQDFEDGLSTLDTRTQQRTSFIQGGLFAENLESLRLGFENGESINCKETKLEDCFVPIKETVV